MTVGQRDKRALAVLGAVLALAFIYWMASSSSSSVKVSAPVESIDRVEKGLANLRTRAASLPAKEVVLKQAGAELAEREKGLISGDTADQAQAQLLQVLRRVAKAQTPPLEIRQVELGQPRSYGNSYGLVTVSVTVDCRIEELINLLSTLSAQPETIATDEIRFGTANPKQKNMPVRLTVSGIVAQRLAPKKGTSQF
ncbi:MAG TPA: type II secretion system protein GspM [Bryobacteraceae bacterium]|nr:type II secretion system protein GspM [Bryobacteraceae bacterium]